MGESITEATIVSLERVVGDTVIADEVVATLETDKVSVEVYAPQGGVVTDVFVNIDDVVKVGAPIYSIDSSAVASLAPAPAPPSASSDQQPPPPPDPPVSPPLQQAPPPPAPPPSHSPAHGSSVALSFLSGSSATYADVMFERWRADPSSVHASWDAYFRTDNFQLAPDAGGGGGSVMLTTSIPASEGADTMRALHLIAAFQKRGHERADLDPLKLEGERPKLDDLEPSTYGFGEADAHRPLKLSDNTGSSVVGLLGSADVNHDGHTTLSELLNFLRETYCETIGVEAEHITDLEKSNWLRSRLEVPKQALSKEKRLHILERLAYSEKFEAVLATKFNTAKRFGLEGVESMIPGMKVMVDSATLLGVTDVIIGMPHRGRLNVLCNVLRKPVEVIFREFAGTQFSRTRPLSEEEADWSSSGDVKYHLGTSFERAYPDGRRVSIELLPNPSHLEAVDPLVVGKARARMDMKGDDKGDTVLPILVHGDAAFAGQGIVYETFQMFDLEAYQCGGTVHVICNNQLGFTANPNQGRSTTYASDLGKAFGAPIFHVNADDPEAVCRVFDLAVAWRQQFKTDIVIDIIGYRKYGHNEIDEPTFTQPEMYERIRSQKNVLDKYVDTLETTVPNVSREEALAVIDSAVKTFNEAYEKRDSDVAWDRDMWGQHWAAIVAPHSVGRGAWSKTGVDRNIFEKVGNALSTVPEGFTVHRRLTSRFKQFARAIETGENITWPLAEQLAFGTLLLEGIPVRFTGQDVERGTFTHRHAVVHDQKTGATHTFCNHIDPEQSAKLYIANSLLSEYGVLGYELGYSMETPDVLVVWEAQFGDFVNGAQIIIDQFLSSGEAKWMRQSGLVLLLPHGYQGQGPEHSSCRVERFLASSDEDPDIIPLNLHTLEGQTRQVQLNNWQVINPTTPANYFHALRRQQHRDFRKPLIVASTKALLRHKLAVSSFQDISTGSRFRRTYPELYPDEVVSDDEIRRLILCSGKIYYELLEARRAEASKSDVAIVRIEQISPFPFDQVANYAKQYPNAEIVWCQEEPKNMGCWYFVRDRIMTATRSLNHKEQRPGYVGRTTMASTAEGYGSAHDAEQAKIIQTALSDRLTAVPFGRMH